MGLQKMKKTELKTLSSTEIFMFEYESIHVLHITPSIRGLWFIRSSSS